MRAVSYVNIAANIYLSKLNDEIDIHTNKDMADDEIIP